MDEHKAHAVVVFLGLGPVELGHHIHVLRVLIRRVPGELVDLDHLSADIA
jgi:hypothetical protein